MFARHVLDPTVEFLAKLAGTGSALEFAIGTGRVAIPLSAKGISVSGIELSQPMIDQLRRKVPLADDLPVVVGDMATATVPKRFSPGVRRLQQHRQPAYAGRAGGVLP
ncbi:class I SAM-dependent methyltransferase [Solwaraspora sp. WMMD791]|uniref:class I SAM-dependent methyltransferase n=1 Tax=Solwaraspora sp. WMMD791 TaxID=3016086 RepID=UPI00249C026C|nr:class I SAM-dependent methyltransferase [Solwaraspora sp. WMMD791]WFE26900.1 class I SAM-dependent methyltransferase [Solwaraspora sp. WMMD791]